MMYGKIVLIIISVILFSGCLEEITGRLEKVDMMYVNLSVVTKDDQTFIEDIQARGSEIPKIQRPGNVLPGKFPAIYVDLRQSLNISNPSSPLKAISLQNGQNYNGPGNYSFKIQLMEKVLNKTQPVIIYAEIIDNESKRTGRTMVAVNWTE